MRTKLWNGWEIVDKIGEGRSGDVYRAVKKSDGMNLYCAIKYVSLPRNISELDELVKRGIIKDKSEAINYYSKVIEDLKKEIAIMQKFNGNCYIIDCLDYFQETKVDGTGFDFYLRMELATEVTSYFNNKKDILSDVVQMGIDICSSLELLCKEGIIHKDIKPSNIFIGSDGKFKLGDFGIASNLNQDEDKITGTYSYMAPEVYNKQKINKSTDLYSLGLVMYYFLNNNKLPFINKFVTEDGAFKIRMSGMNVPKIKKVNSDLMSIILKACSYDANIRYKNPTAMKKDLEDLLKGNIATSNSSNAIPNIVSNFSNNSSIPTVLEKTVSIYDAKVLESGNLNNNSSLVSKKSDVVSTTKGVDNNALNNVNVVPNKFNKMKKVIYDFFNDRIMENFRTLKDNLADKDFWIENKKRIIVIVIIALLILFLRGCVFSDKKCKAGYVNSFGICVKGWYTCDEGYSLNKDNKCSKTLKSIDANVKYVCEDGYVLQDKLCIKNDTKEPKSAYQCAGLGTLKGNKCVQEQSTDAAVMYNCPTGYLYYDSKCFTASNEAAKATYYCPSGYTLSGTKCNKTEYTNPTVGSGTYQCNSGETLSNGKCYINATSVDGWLYDYCSDYPSYYQRWCKTTTYTCPSGYTKSGTQCYRSATYSSGSSSCSKGTLSGGKCVYTTTTAASVKYTCSSGYTVYGNQCIKTSSKQPTQKYYCPSGITLRGNQCVTTISVDAIQGYECDEGYILAGATCVLNDQKDAEAEYSCSKVYTLNGSKCEKYSLKRPTIHYGEQK